MWHVSPLNRSISSSRSSDRSNHIKTTETSLGTNLNKGVKIQNVWEAHKTVLRGNMILLNGKDKRQKESKYHQIQTKIKEKESGLKKGQVRKH